MIGVDQVLNKCLDRITICCKIAWHHIGYVIHYNENTQGLHDETKKLESELTRIDRKVKRARNNGEIPEKDVIEWTKSAEGIKVDVEKFLVDRARENKWCFKWCPNISWRYRLGKESKEKTARVISLKEEGEKYMTLEVAHHAPPMKFGYNFSQGYEVFDSRAKNFDDITKALEDPCIKMIGVYGPGGVGKTTMVVQIGKLAKRNGLFDDVAIATISQTLNEKTVKEKLAIQLDLTLDGSAYQLYNRLNNGKKNLIILDDVWEKFNLVDIEIPITDGKKGCKVVITSRIQRLCQMMQMPVDQEDSLIGGLAEPEAWTKEFLIGILEETEAWTLFKKTAGISVDFEIPSEAKEVCEKCGGLPVAIRAVAAALKGKGKHAWKDALRQLKSFKIKEIAGIDRNLLISLKWSYDRLEPKDARSCFLLCSLFPEDADISIDDWVRYSIGMRLLDENLIIFDEVRDRVLAMVDVLKTSCLLLDGRNDNEVKMHDIIRDVAISIAEDEKGYMVKHGIQKWPKKGTYERYTAISLRSTTYIQELPNELECRRLHTLVLKCCDSSCTNIPNSFFNGMENNLEILDLSEMSLESYPSSLPMLVQLRMLCLNGLSRDISLLGRLMNLEILCLRGIKELPPEIRQLTRLRLLDLENCTELRVIPPNVISNLTQLEELCISDDFDQWGVEGTYQERENASLFELNSLTLLTTLKVHMPRLMLLPNNLCFEKLTRFKISIGKSFRNSKEHSSTRILKLCDVPIEDKLKVLLEKVEELYLNKLQGLKKVQFHDGDGRGFFELKILGVIDCDDVDHLFRTPERFLKSQPQSLTWPFRKLCKLHVGKCRLKCLFPISIARFLVGLQYLRIHDCEDMEGIVGEDRQGNDEEIIFHQLKEMVLQDLPNLRSFCLSLKNTSTTEASISNPIQPLFCEKVAFPALEELTIDGVNNISVIWDKQLKPPVQEEKESFCQLRNLAHLQKLFIEKCANLKAIVVADREGGANEKPLVFPELISLRLHYLGNLRSFFGNYGPEEEKITKHELNEEILQPQPQPLFNEKIVFPCLEQLVIWGLNMKEIWISTPPTNSFNNLRRLLVWHCQNLLYVGPSKLLFGSLQNLQSLTIRHCLSIEEVFIKTRGLNAREGIIVSGDDDEAAAATTTTEQVQISLVLPRLNDVTFYDLPRLRKFCSGYKLPRSILAFAKGCPLLESDHPNMPNV